MNTYPCILIQEHVNLRWVMEVRVSQSSILDKIKCHGAYILKKKKVFIINFGQYRFNPSVNNNVFFHQKSFSLFK